MVFEYLNQALLSHLLIFNLFKMEIIQLNSTKLSPSVKSLFSRLLIVIFAIFSNMTINGQTCPSNISAPQSCPLPSSATLVIDGSTLSTSGQEFCINPGQGDPDPINGCGTFRFTNLPYDANSGCVATLCFSPAQGCGNGKGEVCVYLNGPNGTCTLYASNKDVTELCLEVKSSTLDITICRPGGGPVSLGNVTLKLPYVVTCPNPDGGTFQCVADVPKNCNQSLVKVVSNCTYSIGATSSTSGVGCPSDPYKKVCTFTVSDANGKTIETCKVTYTAADTQAPSPPAAPANVTVQCVDNTPIPAKLTANDNCDGSVEGKLIRTFNSGTGCKGSPLIETRKWTFTDKCGNASTVTQIITVEDTQAPVPPTAPANVTVQCFDNMPLAANLTANDNCSGEVKGVLSSSNNGGKGCKNDPYILTRVWTFTDKCGNSSTTSQTVTVRDDTPPVVTKGTIGSCFKTVADAEAAAIAATSTRDNCGGTVTKTASTSGTCSATITVTATDACGNTATVQYTTRIDNEAPVITKLGELATCYNSVADAERAALGLTSATDNCTGILRRSVSTKNTCPFIITVTYTDGCGNSSSVDFILEDIAAKGGKVTYNGQSSYTICPDEKITLVLQGYVGRITKWQTAVQNIDPRNPGAAQWQDIPGSAGLTSLMVNGNDIDQPTYYRVEICALCGKCAPPYYTAYAQTFTLYKNTMCMSMWSIEGKDVKEDPLTLVKTYPSPAQDKINIEMSGLTEGVASIDVMDVTGRIVHNEKQPVNKGFNTINMTINELSKGLYILRVTDANGRKVTSKISKM